MQSTTSEQSKTSTINGNLIQSGGGFSFNDKLFDEYMDNRSCAIFKDIHGNTFESITIYQVVQVDNSADSYISTNKGLFLYNVDTGKATALSYTINDIVYMRIYLYTTEPNINTIIGFYPLNDSNYGVRKITFDTTGILTSVNMDGVTIPHNVTWMTISNGFDGAEINTNGNIGYSICYKDNSMWLLICLSGETSCNFSEIRRVTISNITEITQAINKNTALVKQDDATGYFVIDTARADEATGESVEYSSIGYIYPHIGVSNITQYAQYYTVRNDIGSTIELIIENDLLSFMYYVYSSDILPYPTDMTFHYIDSDESNGGINGGHVYGNIKHRMLTTENKSGYTDGTNVYTTKRHIFASSTRLMDINDNPYAALMYVRAEDTDNYSILPSTGKTPIFTINASIEIDNEKYGNVIATDYNLVKGLYYIYTNSHVGIYFMTTQQLTWSLSGVITQVNNIYTFNNITVIDGQAKEFVNGIMTTTAMNGPTFDQLFAEIDELRKRIAALESKT